MTEAAIVVLCARSGPYLYTAKLTKKLAEKGVRVGVLRGLGGGLSCRYAWRRGLAAVLKVALGVLGGGYRVVNVQFEYSMFASPPVSHVMLLVLLALLKPFAKSIVTLHGIVAPWIVKRRARKMVAVYYRILSVLADKVVVLNRLQKLLLESYGARKQIIVIPHGSDACTCPRGERRSAGHVLYHGFIRPSKGLEELILAVDKAREHSNISLIILGSIPYQAGWDPEERKYAAKILALAASRDYVSVKLGYTELEKVRRAACRSGILALPYLDWNVESSGVVHELMSCGATPVVSKRPRFLADLEPERECLAVSPDPDSLAQAMLRAAGDEKLRERIAAKLREKASTRNWSLVAERYADIIKDLR